MPELLVAQKLSEDLKKAGFAEPQARVLAHKFGELAHDRLVPKIRSRTSAVQGALQWLPRRCVWQCPRQYWC
jgi:hypothetical protein